MHAVRFPALAVKRQLQQLTGTGINDKQPQRARGFETSDVPELTAVTLAHTGRLWRTRAAISNTPGHQAD